ncbi:UPF0548 protein At2g17695 isoform X2 [Abrus precatorius]|uniref:UPF0548 protein At2g17695 isoform X2 n=1 Tax=Abrus precatorius TaxID=3816 RepID=A0A8B8KSJ1_ABRPR|nr:UPF0548 protein At2g17695 isoform X2 [Abrus precatorius]
MVFLSWGRPSAQDQKAIIHKSGTFNYDDKYKGATAKSLASLKEDQALSKDGFLLNNARVLVGSGIDTFEKAKTALKTWRHFGLNWAFVDPKTPVQQGTKFCACVKEFFPWLMMPLQVVYVNETKIAKNRAATFGFGSGTLDGHLLFAVYLVMVFCKRKAFLSNCTWCGETEVVLACESFRNWKWFE